MSSVTQSAGNEGSPGKEKQSSQINKTLFQLLSIAERCLRSSKAVMEASQRLSDTDDSNEEDKDHSSGRNNPLPFAP